MMMGHDDHAADNRDGPMSDNGATQYCTHTTDGTICDTCMGTPEGPEMWESYTVNKIIREGLGDEEYFLAAPVEAWAKEVKELLDIVNAQRMGIVDPSSILKAQRLLANWPVKEDA